MDVDGTRARTPRRNMTEVLSRCKHGCGLSDAFFHRDREMVCWTWFEFTSLTGSLDGYRIFVIIL